MEITRENAIFLVGAIIISYALFAVWLHFGGEIPFLWDKWNNNIRHFSLKINKLRCFRSKDNNNLRLDIQQPEKRGSSVDFIVSVVNRLIHYTNYQGVIISKGL